MASLSVKQTTTNEINGARDKANVDFIELVSKERWESKNNHQSFTPNDWNMNGQLSG